MNVSRRDSTAVQRGLVVVTLINAAMAGMSGTAFALTGMILGLLLLTQEPAGRTASILTPAPHTGGERDE